VKLDSDYRDPGHHRLETDLDKRADIISRKHGEMSQKVSKSSTNARRKTDEILKTAADKEVVLMAVQTCKFGCHDLCKSVISGQSWSTYNTFYFRSSHPDPT
jgi:hypothetical protein